jgi:ABC-type transport system involved in multi-copper enzyme maturation permease subunit
MMTQTLALLLDAYRELNAKKMFWIVLVLSALVVIAFAGTGINERGMTMFGMQFQSELNTTVLPKATWYKYLFSNFGIGFWLTWCAMILALISTASIFPDFTAGGSVDLYLSRPISRLRLFLTKYATGLLFVALQVAVFASACFLVIGIRGGAWEPRIFLSIPLVVLVFSFLFCICVLLGLLTRSVVASLLLTIIFWLLIFGIDVAEKSTLSARIGGQIEASAFANQLADKDKKITQSWEQLAAGDASAHVLDHLEQDRAALQAKKLQSDPGRQNWATAHRILFGAKSILPKTSETNSLIDRWLNIIDEIGQEQRQRREQRRYPGSSEGRTQVHMGDMEVAFKVQEALRDRPASWVLGTSIAFEAVVLALAAWVFCRRDY